MQLRFDATTKIPFSLKSIIVITARNVDVLFLVTVSTSHSDMELPAQNCVSLVQKGGGVNNYIIHGGRKFGPDITDEVVRAWRVRHHSTNLTMASHTRLAASAASNILRTTRPTAFSRTWPLAAGVSTSSVRSFTQLNSHAAVATNPANVFSSPGSSHSGPTTYFSSHKRLPTNTVIRFVPQQTAWIVERMGKFNRILEPGLAILIPFIDRIAYVKSLKENALEIPSQSAITADNVTLELDGVLYTRVFDAYKAR